ncbi:MAG: hypothetical protein CMH63_02630 [Nanoarchaeota archaeon]|jgi:hypothetical protein|nr:hypothetical protein [Nanoarchaeota archaeon]|tara:strand:- start:16471 stop:16899 length:429 start_codon:yes stop_codon:yes gene_type:complete
MSGNGFNHGGEGYGKRGASRKTSVGIKKWGEHEPEPRKKITPFYDTDGNLIAEGHLNERGEITEGPLEIRLKDGKILRGDKEYTPTQYAKMQREACSERGEGFYYNLTLTGHRVIKMKTLTKSVRKKGKMVIGGYSEYRCGN